MYKYNYLTYNGRVIYFKTLGILCFIGNSKLSTHVIIRKSQWQFNVSLLTIELCQNSQKYCNDPKFSDRKVWADIVDPDQTAPIRVYTVCYSVCIFWTHYFMVEVHCLNFRMITAIFRVSENLEVLRYLPKYFFGIGSG